MRVQQSSSRSRRPRRGPRDPADRSGPARLHPGVLRDAGDRRDRPGARSPTGAWPRPTSSRTWAARAAAIEAYRSAPTPNVIVLEATADREALIEQLDELAQYCDAGTKVIVIGKVNDIVLYRQLIARGVSEYLVRAVHRRRFRRGDLEPVPRARRQAARPRDLGRRRQGRRRRLDDRAQSRLDSRRRARDVDRSSPISTSASAPPASTSTRTRRRASPKRCSRPTASTPTWSTACCPNAATTCILLAAPAMLDRVYDFSETSFDSLIDTMRASTPVDRARRAARLDGAGRGACWSAPTRSSSSRARSRQPAQRQEHRRQYPQRAAARPSAAPGDQRCRHAQAPGNPGRRFRQDHRDGADRRSFRTTPSCSARPPTTAR